MQQRYSDVSPRFRVEKPTMSSCVALKFPRFQIARIDITSLYLFTQMSDAPPYIGLTSSAKIHIFYFITNKIIIFFPFKEKKLRFVLVIREKVVTLQPLSRDGSMKFNY